MKGRVRVRHGHGPSHILLRLGRATRSAETPDLGPRSSHASRLRTSPHVQVGGGVVAHPRTAVARLCSVGGVACGSARSSRVAPRATRRVGRGGSPGTSPGYGRCRSLHRIGAVATVEGPPGATRLRPRVAVLAGRDHGGALRGPGSHAPRPLAGVPALSRPEQPAHAGRRRRTVCKAATGQSTVRGTSLELRTPHARTGARRRACRDQGPPAKTVGTPRTPPAGGEEPHGARHAGVEKSYTLRVAHFIEAC